MPPLCRSTQCPPGWPGLQLTSSPQGHLFHWQLSPLTLLQLLFLGSLESTAERFLVSWRYLQKKNSHHLHAAAYPRRMFDECSMVSCGSCSQTGSKLPLIRTLSRSGKLPCGPLSGGFGHSLPEKATESHLKLHGKSHHQRTAKRQTSLVSRIASDPRRPLGKTPRGQAWIWAPRKTSGVRKCRAESQAGGRANKSPGMGAEHK